MRSADILFFVVEAQMGLTALDIEIANVIKFFKNSTWKPTIVEVFAGKLDYKKYPFFDRIMIQFIMWMTKGPTNTNVEIEYTNWDKVSEFSKTFHNL